MLASNEVVSGVCDRRYRNSRASWTDGDVEVAVCVSTLNNDVVIVNEVGVISAQTDWAAWF